MKRKFTFLTAAFALLAFMTPSLAGWGQTRDVQTLTNANIVAAGTGATGYQTWSITDGNSHTWNAYAIKNQHSNATSGYHYLQIRKYQSNTAYYIQVPELGTQITSITLTVSSSQKPMDGGNNTATLFFSNSSNTSSTGTGVASGTGTSTVTIDCSSLNLNTGYLTADGAVRIWDVAVTYTTGSGTTTYTVTFDCDGGIGCPEDITGIEEGDDNFTVPSDAPTKEHYAFDGFYIGSDDEMYESGETYTIESDLELTASWTIDKYNVTMNDDGTNAELYAEYGQNMLNEDETAAINYGTELTLGAEDLPSNHTVVWTVKNTNNVDVSAEVLSGTTVTVPDYDIIISGTVTEIPTYTITFDPGTGTCTQVPTDYLAGTVITEFPTATPSAACVSRGWTFAGWAIAHVADGTTTNPIVSSYTVNGNAILYAVYSVTEGGSVFDNTAGGDFMIYATVDGNNYYATGTGSKISTTTTASEAAVYTFEKPQGYGNGEYAIKYGSNYITYNSGTNLGTSTNLYKWTITSSEENGSWCLTSETTDRGFVFQEFYNNSGNVVYSHQFGGYKTSNINGDDYFAVEIGGVNATTYATDPECLEKVATPVISLAGNTYTGSQTTTITCTTTGATIYYTTDGTVPTTSSTQYTAGANITIAQSMTLKAIAVNQGMEDSEVAEATYTIQYTLNVGIEHVEYYSTLYDYYFEDEVEHWDEITVDNGVALVRAGADVRISVDMVDDCYVLNGFNVTYGSTTIQATDHMAENRTYGFTMPASDATLADVTTQATQKTLTVTGLENVSYTNLLKGNDSEIITLDANNQTEICEQLTVEVVGLAANSGYFLQSVTLTYGGETITVTPEYGVYTFTMPSTDATLTFTTREVVTNTYTKVTSVMPGKHYIIVTAQASSNKYYAMGTKNSNGSYMNKVEVSIDNNTVTVAENVGVSEVVISGYADNYTLHTAEGYLVGGNKSMNTNGNSNSKWIIGFNNADQALIGWTSNNTTYTLQYNASNPRFACYSTDQAKVCLYEKVDDKDLELYSPTTLSSTNQITVPEDGTLTVKTNGSLTNTDAVNLVLENGAQLFSSDANLQATVQKDIEAYTSDDDGWNLIASPIIAQSGLVASNIEGLIPTETTTTYDLYFLDETATMWRNYKPNNDYSGFAIEKDKGYLYANSEGTTINFAGTLASGTSANVTLTKDGDGWNLIGNPLPFNASVNNGYYVIEGRTVTATTGGTIAPCTGIIVQATTNGETVTFSKPTSVGSANNGNIQMVLAQTVTTRGESNTQTLDNAIVSFNEGSKLGKFYFGTQNANIYIPQNGKDYAIVNAEAQGEMPLCIKANMDGEYTLTVSTTLNSQLSTLNLNYLHLIDNMTGADVDLLAEPSYTFSAKTTDYESRFKLVFFANTAIEDNSNETFAFFSDGQLIVNGEGTLQIFDALGRQLMCKQLSTLNCQLSTVNYSPGVYMLRLVNGDNVKVQKVVVR